MSEEYAANKLTLRMEPEGEISASLREVKFLSPAGLLRWVTDHNSDNEHGCSAPKSITDSPLLCTSALVLLGMHAPWTIST